MTTTIMMLNDFQKRDSHINDDNDNDVERFSETRQSFHRNIVIK